MSSQLHCSNVAYGSCLYSCKRSIYSYLVSNERYAVILYGHVLRFFSTNNGRSLVLHKLICVNQYLTACFFPYKCVTAIEDSIDKVYIVTKHVQPPYATFNSADVYPVKFGCSHCISVFFCEEFMDIASYSCAFQRN